MTTRPAGAAPAPHPDDELDPREAFRRQQDGALLIDVREPSEWALGGPGGALSAPLSRLPSAIAEVAPDLLQELLLICAGGRRSLTAQRELRALGYARVRSVAGGFQDWREAGLPVAVREGLETATLERYDRHLRLAEIGVAGQRRLLASRVVLVGAGGLGSPAALYLAAAGIGHLRVVDDDRVECSNLQRQVLHAQAAIGGSKAESARERLAGLNPDIRIDAIVARLTPDNAEDLLEACDLVIDGADNFPTRYLINDTCLRLGRPWVYGAVERFVGQLTVFVPGQGPCYRCLFPEPPPPGSVPSCAEAGVLGVLPGVIGLLQATEAIKHLLGLGRSLQGRLLRYDALAMRFSETHLPRDPACPGCGAAGPPADAGAGSG